MLADFASDEDYEVVDGLEGADHFVCNRLTPLDTELGAVGYHAESFLGVGG